MATLERIRKKAWLLVAVIGVALFAFIITDFLRSGSTFFQQKKENIITVNGKEVHFQDFQVKVEERLNEIKRNTNRNLSDDETQQVRQQVLDELIDDILYKEEAKKLGLVVNKQEYMDMVMGDNTSPILQQISIFQNPQTGRFDKNIFMEYLQTVVTENFDMFPEEALPQLRQMKQEWLKIENIIQTEQLKNKFAVLISSAILTNKIEAKSSYENNKISVDFDYVSQAYTSVPDGDVSVTDADIQKRYNETKDLYKQEDAKLINYIAVNIVPSQNDFQTVESKLDGLRSSFETSERVSDIVQTNSDVPYVDAYLSYNSLSQNLKNFVGNSPVGSVEGPVLINNTYHLYKLEGEKTASDSVKVNILPMAMSSDDTVLKTIADSLMQVVKSGTSFEEMAVSVSGSQFDGNMGWVTEEDLARELDVNFKDQIFDAKLNELFIAHSAMGGSYIVQVTERTQPVKKYKIADIQIQVNPSQETKTQLYNDLSQYIAANHSVDAMKDNAAESGYNVRSDIEVAKDQIGLGGIQSTRQIIQWAFNSDKGAISDIYESQNGEYFVVAAVSGSLTKGYRSLASVSDVIKRELMNEKKGEKIVADLKAKNLTTLEQYADAMNTSTQSVKFVTFGTLNISGIGNEPILNAKAPLAPVGEVAGPYAGKSRVYAIYVTDKKVSEEAYSEEMHMKQAQTQNSYRKYQLMQSTEVLRENANIVNNFNRFY